MKIVKNRKSNVIRHRLVRQNAGFTLVEMLVVLAIISLIVGLIGPRIISYLSDSKVKAAQIQMENIASALDLYYLDTNHYPTTAEGLPALVQKPASAPTWNGPYLKSASALTDPWGHPYVYKFPGQSGPFDLGAMGPDGHDTDRPPVQRMGSAPK